MKILEILDSLWNLCWYVRIRCIIDSKNSTVHDELEMKWDFFVLYPDYLDYFLDLFNFDRFRNNCIARIDYAFDFQWVEIKEFWDSRKTVSWKHFPVFVDSTITYFRYQNQRHKLVFYNKKLDILDKKKYKIQNMSWEFPYTKYLENDIPISRVEYRKNSQSFSDLENSSFSWVMWNLRSMALQYLENFIDCRFSKTPILRNRQDKIKKDTIYANELKRKSNLAFSRASSYIDSFIELNTEWEFFDYLSKKFWNRLYMYLNKNWIDEQIADFVIPEITL